MKCVGRDVCDWNKSRKFSKKDTQRDGCVFDIFESPEVDGCDCFLGRESGADRETCN